MELHFYFIDMEDSTAIQLDQLDSLLKNEGKEHLTDENRPKYESNGLQ